MSWWEYFDDVISSSGITEKFDLLPTDKASALEQIIEGFYKLGKEVSEAIQSIKNLLSHD